MPHNNKSAHSSIDKFNSLLAAAEAIAGLTPTDANYEEAVATLKRRFGNPQLIINRHMEALLNVTGVISHYMTVWRRGLKALKVPARSYGGLCFGEQIAS